MRDHERFFPDSAEAGIATERDLPPLRDSHLPLSVRLSGHLVDMLLTASELQTMLRQEDARTLSPIAPAIDRIYSGVDELLRRLAH